MSYENALRTLIEEGHDVVVLTAENRSAIRGLPPLLGKRFIDFGICEQTMIGAAAGLALRGRTPIAHALTTFLLMRAFEFIRTDVGIPGLPVKLVGAVPGFLSEANGPTHQAIEDVSLMRGIPGMQVFAPADEVELALGVPHVVKSPAPTYVRYCALKPAVEHRAPFEIGKAEVLGEGRDVTLLVYGMLLREAVAAKAMLEAQGLSVGLVNVRMPKPIDADAVLAAASRSKLLVTIEDHFKIGGLFSIVSELLVERGVAARVHSISLEDRWFKPALLPEVLSHEGFTGEQLAQRVRKVLG